MADDKMTIDNPSYGPWLAARTKADRPLVLAKFLAWFVGFTENIEGIPTLAQWQRVQEQVRALEKYAVRYEDLGGPFRVAEYATELAAALYGIHPDDLRGE